MHGRVQPSPQQAGIPVLTGMPVSGMAYLDRPSQAGYFIFPDLSVRHEGSYKLSFNLYEETKDEKDQDAEPTVDSPAKPATVPGTAHGSFDWRLEVKSATFKVYSAKKFPGLAESTALSRVVQEQGCRVRIRRDVRMRRREGKPSGEYDDYNNEDDYRRGRTGTPESVHESYTRQRSLSGTPADGPYGPDATGSTSYLNFGSNASAQYQTPQFAQPAPPAPLQPQQQPYAPAPSSFNPPPPPPLPAYRPSAPFVPHNYTERASYGSQYGPSRDGYDGTYRRPSASYGPPPPSTAYPTVDQSYSRSQQRPSYAQYPSRPHSPGPVNLAPIKMPPIEPKLESTTSPNGPYASAGRLAPSLPSPSYQERRHSGSDYPSQPYGSSYGSPSTTSPYSQYSPSASDGARSGKRPFEAVFSTTALHQPLHNGMRPASSHAGSASSALDDDDMEPPRMIYPRADGSNGCRTLPTSD
jgi:hypothetical protein